MVIETPIGALSVASSGGAVSGVHFGAVADAGPVAGDPVLAAAVEELERYFAGALTDFEVPVAAAARHRVRARGVARDDAHPVRRDEDLRRGRRGRRRPGGGPGGRCGLQPQPAPGDRAVPPGRRRRRQAGRLRRRRCRASGSCSSWRRGSASSASPASRPTPTLETARRFHVEAEPCLVQVPAAQRSMSPSMNASTASCASWSAYCTGGDFMK